LWALWLLDGLSSLLSPRCFTRNLKKATFGK
jgi:hypothetical protein